MAILLDHQIRGRLAAAPPLAEGVRDPRQIQAASLDLTVGQIYIPGRRHDEPGGADMPLTLASLAQGHTAVIRTRETLALDSSLAGIAFPPANVSLRGLLTTNPGHIDPGYKGPLHLTVINMGREPFPLREGDRIMRVLFIPLLETPDKPYNGPVASVTPELLNRLSADFLDIESRATKIAERAVKRAQIWALTLPLAVALVTVLGPRLFSNNDDIDALKRKVAVLESKLDLNSVKGRMDALEHRVNAIEETTPRRNPEKP